MKAETEKPGDASPPATPAPEPEESPFPAPEIEKIQEGDESD